MSRISMAEMIGKRFGRLLVKKNAGKRPGNTHTFFECICDCGNIHTLSKSNLLKGNANSCGCIAKEILIARSTTHGQYVGNNQSPIIRIFQCMYMRCYCESHEFYHLYGGRGISICDEWLHDREAFVDWAFTNGFKNGLTIDRINNDKGYNKDNCRFVSQKRQTRNTRVSVMLTIKGETKHICDWVDIYNNVVPYTTAKSRYRLGWEHERIFTVKIDESRRRKA